MKQTEENPVFSHSAVFMGAQRGVGKGAVVFGAPLDVTTSSRPGTRFGPGAIRENSYSLETYDIKSGKDLESIVYHDAGDVELAPGVVRGSLDLLKDAASAILNAGGRPLALGGEHLISLPLIEATHSTHPNLVVIHIDAHADMRQHYLGLELSHATVMRRVCEVVGRDSVFSYGVRSASSDEIEYAKHPAANFHAGSLDALVRARQVFSGRPVYLSVDIDVVDPAYAPGTGAPEPGGVTSGELLCALSRLDGLRIAGADLVEVAPAYDPAGITATLGAKIIRQMLYLMSF